VPTPVVSVEITQVLDTMLVIETLLEPLHQYQNIALSAQYEPAANDSLLVPTQVVSEAVTPILETRLVIDTVPDT